jgi:Ca2+-binding RTX toxin-like protein
LKQRQVRATHGGFTAPGLYRETPVEKQREPHERFGTLQGGDGDDVLRGGAGSDSVYGGKGNDFILQDIESARDTIDGGAGIDTANYNVTDLTGRAIRETVASVGMRGRYIRIYHTQKSAAEYNSATLSLAGLKVYAGGIDIAGRTGVTSRVGADVMNSQGVAGFTPDALERNENNDRALTDGVVGSGAALASAKTNYPLNVESQPYAEGLYIELDLGAVYDIDSLALWGRADAPGESDDLRIYVSPNAFPGEKDTKKSYNSYDARYSSKPGDYFKLDADWSIRKIDVARVETADNTLSLAGASSKGIVADLSKGTVIKTLDGTRVGVNASGRYIRIYHVQTRGVGTYTADSKTWPVDYDAKTLSLADVKVYAGGVEVAQGKQSSVNADGSNGIRSNERMGPKSSSAAILDTGENNNQALTDGIAGNGAALASAKAYMKWGGIGGTDYPVAYGLYIDIDLKYRYALDSISLWGRADKPEESNNLRIFVSDTPFPTSPGFNFYSLSEDSSVTWVDVKEVASAESTVTDTLTVTTTDTLMGIENLVGTMFGDSLTGDGNANVLAGGAGNDVLDGGASNDTLAGGAGVDTVKGGGGDDLILQDNARLSDTLDGGAGIDTVDYSASPDAGVDADLGRGTAILAGTTVSMKGTLGQYIRIYHNDSYVGGELGLTGMKVYAGGRDVASGLRSSVGTDGNAKDMITVNNSTVALTDAAVGGGWNSLPGDQGNVAYANTVVGGAKGYIELKLDSSQAIDSISLWGDANNLGDSKNLRVYVSNAPFNPLTTYASLAADTTVARFDLAETVISAGMTTWTDTLVNIENLVGSAMNDTLKGDANANVLSAGAGNDVLDGGAGNDTLAGGAGSDIYKFQRGGGADTIQENDATAGNTDVLQFGADINASQLWLRRISNTNDLEVSVIGTTDKVTVSNWYLGNACHVEQIKSGEGKTLLDTDVDKLVQAMSSFAPPAMGQTTLTSQQQSALAPALAANWH